MKRFFIVFLAACALFFQCSALHATSLIDMFSTLSGENDAKYKVQFVEGDKEAADEVLLIKLKGIIHETDESDYSPFEFKKDMLETLNKDIETAIERPSVKAVLIEIDSPGGEVTASDIIYHRLQKINKSDKAKKPVVAIFGTLGASGAYYAACAADQIWAHPTSIIGSIGVIMQTANLEKLAQMIGYRHISLKSDRTPKKDILSPFREMTPEEKSMLMSLIDGMYDRFVGIVAVSRKKTKDEIVKIADGGIYTSDQALKNGLIDGIGYREDAFDKAKELAGVKSAKLVKRKIKKGFAELLSEITEMRSGVPSMISAFREILNSADTPTMLYQLKTSPSK